MNSAFRSGLFATLGVLVALVIVYVLLAFANGFIEGARDGAWLPFAIAGGAIAAIGGVMWAIGLLARRRSS